MKIDGNDVILMKYVIIADWLDELMSRGRSIEFVELIGFGGRRADLRETIYLSSDLENGIWNYILLLSNFSDMV